MDVYWKSVQKGVGVKSVLVEFFSQRQKRKKKNLFNTITISLDNDIMIRMTIGEWQNIGGDIARQIKEKASHKYGKPGEPENGSS